MAEKCFIRRSPRWRLMLLVVFMVSPPSRGASCPSSCICVFEDLLQDSTASCQLGNFTLEVSWPRNFGYATLRLTCKEAYKGLQYECDQFPQFDVKQRDAILDVKSCAPAALNCVSSVFAPPAQVLRAELTNVVSPYESQHFADLQHLDALKINLKYNDTEIPAVAINSLKNLTHCIITGGNLQLSPSVFQQSSLEYLQLVQNNITELPPRAFSGLRNLKFLEIRENFLDRLSSESFKGLDSLENLVIENDRVTHIEADAISSLKQLSALELKNNRVELVPNGLFTGLDILYKLRFTMNQVELKLDTHVFADLPPSVRVVDVPTSRVRFLPEHLLNGSSNLHQLYFHQNQIETLPPKLLATNTGLKYVDFSHNKIKELPDKIFAAMNRVEHINLGYNLISSLKGDIFTHSPELKEVYLNQNQISDMERDIFNGTSLRTVTLAHNSLRRIPGDSSPGWAANKLNLSHNELSVFEDWFVKLSGLENLDLSSNNIETIKESHIHNFKSNITIDLRNNNISQIIRDTNLTQLSSNSRHMDLYLSHNPIVCDCIVTSLLNEWYRYGILADFDEIVCSNNENLSSLDIIQQCQDQKIHPLIISGIVGIIVIILIVIMICIHRYKMKKLRKNIFEVEKSKDNIKATIDNSKIKIRDD